MGFVKAFTQRSAQLEVFDVFEIWCLGKAFVGEEDEGGYKTTN